MKCGDGLRIAMWSGPRNISTAMMRAWENRADTVVTDEPLYGYYLLETGSEHPGRDEVIASQETDWRKVVDYVTGPIPSGRAIWYQKHMTHHLLPEMEYDWLDCMSNCFLIRDPGEVLASYLKTRPDVTTDDLGLPQQVEIFGQVCERGEGIPPVLDARDVLENPRRLLELLCAALEVSFSERMLEWPVGARASDGVWSKYWYGAVEQSTGFKAYRPRKGDLPDEYQDLVAECDEYYQTLYKHRLGA